MKTKLQMFLAICLLAPGAADSQPLDPAGGIVGAIRTFAGRPQSGATVHIVSRQQNTQTAPFHASAVTGADGVFRFNGVPAGAYQLCSNSPDASLLDHCLWGAEKIVNVAPGKFAALAPIALEKGVNLNIKVNDPAGKRDELEGKTAGASLLLMVRTKSGKFAHVPSAGKDKAGASHRVLVPADTDLSVVAFSSTFSIADETGKQDDAKKGLSQDVNIPASSIEKQIVLTVTGVKGQP